MTRINRRLSVFLCLGMISSAAPCFAGDIKPYAEIGLANSDDQFGGRDHISGLIRGGVELTSWLAIEGEAIIGLDDSEREGRFGDVSTQGLDYQLGGYLRLGVPIKKRILPYIRLGVGTAQINETRLRPGEFFRDEDESFTAASIGLGIQGFFGKARKNGIRLDLTSLQEIDYDDEDDENFGTTNLSLTYVRRF